MDAETDFDVLIVGAGLVGAACALALRDSDLSIGVIDAASAPQSSAEWDRRIYALNPASVRFLTELGVWQNLDATRIQAVSGMQIRGDTGGTLEFDAYEAGVASLAHIVEANRLQEALWQAIRACAEVRLFHPRRCTELSREPRAGLRLDDGTALRAALVIGADGASSWVRAAAGLEAQTDAYEASGVVANFQCERDHEGIAYQWFRPDGVLAFLPLPQRHMSMVWSAPEALARELVGLAPDPLAERVAQAGSFSLGALQAVGPAAAFPLQHLRVPQIVAPRVALIGDAAHVVHPLAGQGVNLGFADAQTLSACLRSRESFRDCGDLTLLRRYARERAEPVRLMGALTHGLERLFRSDSPWLRGMRNRGLGWVQAMPAAKNLLIRHALG